MNSDIVSMLKAFQLYVARHERVNDILHYCNFVIEPIRLLETFHSISPFTAGNTPACG